MKNSSLFWCISLTLTIFIAPPTPSADEMRQTPQRLVHKPEVQLEWINPIEECDEGRLCVEGQLVNVGGKSAYHVHLRVDLGGTKYIKPKVSLYSHVDSPIMAPGDKQQFYFELDRQINYKSRGKEKVLEVGKYTYKVVPQWSHKREVKRHRKKRWIN